MNCFEKGIEKTGNRIKGSKRAYIEGSDEGLQQGENSALGLGGVALELHAAGRHDAAHHLAVLQLLQRGAPLAWKYKIQQQ